MISTIEDAVKANNIRTYRRAYVKRRDAITGLFEDDWQEITEHVKKWGTIKVSTDDQRQAKIRFGNIRMTMANDIGLFNPEDNPSSLWYGYAAQVRSLVKIEAGHLHQEQGSDGIWRNYEFPGKGALYDDEAYYDNNALYDVEPVFFEGLIFGDIFSSDKNETSLNIQPKLELFRDYAAKNLTGFTSTGMTASQFCELVRDQTDGSGSYIFRPFFDDTTTNWQISSTSVVYGSLNTSGAQDVFNKNVWQVIENLAEAESFLPRIDNRGRFVFSSKDPSSSTAYEFHGVGSEDRIYGQTIKSIKKYGKSISKYYSRIELKWKEDNTTTSYEIRQSTLSVDGSNIPWLYGQRTFKMDNVLIPTSTVAEIIADSVFNELSSIKNEIHFTSSFITHLDILDRINITYDASEILQHSLWDVNSWSDSVGSGNNLLVWDKSEGDALKLSGDEFKTLSYEIDLDRLETRFVSREV